MDSNAERDGIDNRSSVEVVQVVVVPQLGGHKGRQRWNNTTLLTIVLVSLRVDAAADNNAMTMTTTTMVVVARTTKTAAVTY